MTALSGIINAELPFVEISRHAAQRLATGFLWIYSNEIQARDEQLLPAYWCRFMHQSKVVAVGYFNRHSLIAGRALGFGHMDDPQELLVSRLKQAFIRRLPLAENQAVRMAFSEADLAPGLVVDYYPPYAVLQSTTAGMDLMLPLLEERLPKLFEDILKTSLQGLVLRCDSAVRRLEAVESFKRVSFGDALALSEVEVQEKGVHYTADLIGGQKTGFFLDQRDNRLRFGALVREKAYRRVLDLYCYSGGWGIRALHAGADQVSFVDQSPEAFQLLKKALAANGVSKMRVELHNRDTFEFLKRDKTLYDAVVADPPAFVKSRKNLPQALKAYRKLARLAWRRVRPGGILFACCCSHHISTSDFLNLLAGALVQERGIAHILHRGGQAQDHPVLLSMPETSYLKCIGLLKLATL
jgi:23S rRNA (cytosine1962-C5)-methyltransferase